MAKMMDKVALRRTLGLPMLVLYGLGVTIGAGIYVLVGEAVGRAGIYAPAAFFLSAVVMGFTAGSFVELSGRVPQAAAEAVYVERAFKRPWLTVVVGMAVLIDAMIAAAAISLGAAGYLGVLVPLAESVLVAGVVVSMATLAAWGIRESVGVAAVMTIVEVLGLMAIVGAGLWADPGMLKDLPEAIPHPTDTLALSGVFAASLLAFFAFIGFDDIVNLVEEAKDPLWALPRAIWITLGLVTLIYVLVSFVAVQAVPLAELAASTAPVSLLFERLTGIGPLWITLIAIMATMNGVVIILIMAARVAYGLAREGRLPGWLGEVSSRTRTPLNATVVVALVVLVMALFAPLHLLAEATSAIMLAIFVMVNLALIWLKLWGDPPPQGGMTVPLFVPVLGVVTCLVLLIGPLVFAA